ncbi:unnamed protein product, partial [Oppiella nova]
LNRLFRLIHDNDFFRTHCWESILGRPSCLKQPKYFIDNDLNWLIEIITGFQNFVNTEHLHLNVMGLYQSNALSAERKALNILTIWAVMHNRDKLAKVFWKHSDQPVHLALVISMMFDRLSWYAIDNNMKSDLKQKSKVFADFANGVLDICYNEDIFRANNVLNQSIQDWNYKTAVDIAANAQLRQFLAHPCCQKFLTNTFLGNIRLREINWGMFPIPAAIKILLCAFLVFPLFIWVRFKSNEIEIQDNVTTDDEFEDGYDDIYREDNTESSVITDDTTDQVKVGYMNPSLAKSVANSYDNIINQSKNRFNNSIRGHMFVARPPPLHQMLAMFFSAPITKFYVSQFFYFLYLPLLSLSVIYPGCGLWKLDLLVCIWTTVLCMDYIRRTYIIIKKYTAVPVFLKSLLHNPPLLILDEPTVGVDLILRETIWKHLENLCKTGLTVILTTHYIEEARNAAKVGFMRSGRILAEDSPHHLLRRHQLMTLEEVFLKLSQLDDQTKVHHIIGQDIKHIPVSVYNPEQLDKASSLSELFLDSIDEKHITLVRYKTLKSAIDAVKENDVWAVIHFQTNFSEALRMRSILSTDSDADIINSSSIRLQLDMSNQVIGFQIQRQIFEAFLKFVSVLAQTYGINPEALKPPIIIDPPIYGIPKQSLISFIAPGALIMVAYFATTVMTCHLLIKERSDGLVERSLVAGVTPFEFVLSHIILQTLLLVLQVGLKLMVAFLVFVIPNSGSIISAVILVFLQGLCGLMFGLMISAVCHDEIYANTLGIGAFFPSVMIGGIFWPLESMPTALRYISQTLPSTLAIETLRCILLRGWGGIYGLLGSSGCGKTTLLKCALGRLEPTRGSICLFGKTPGSPDSKVPGPGVGYMPQELALYEEFTIEEILKYFGRLFGIQSKVVDSRIEFLVDLLQLPDKNRMITKLSGGQKRRVSIATALLHNPPLLILDEPTVGLDLILREAIWKHLEFLCQNGLTVIVTTHYIEEARSAQTVGFMRSGRLLAEDSPEGLLRHYGFTTLEAVFLKLSQLQDNRKSDKTFDMDNEEKIDFKSNESDESIDVMVESEIELNSCQMAYKMSRTKSIANGPPVYGSQNPSFNSFVAPGALLVVAYFGTTTVTSHLLIKERTDGLVDRNLVAGVKPLEFVFSHVILQLFILSLQVGLKLILVFIVYTIPTNGSIISASAITFLQGLCGLMFGLMISAICPDEIYATTLCIGAFFPTVMMGGIFWPLESMPTGIRYVSQLLPSTLAIESLRNILLRGWGLSHSHVLIGFIMTILWLLFFGINALAFFVKKL